jgi:hypothetical protein
MRTSTPDYQTNATKTPLSTVAFDALDMQQKLRKPEIPSAQFPQLISQHL